MKLIDIHRQFDTDDKCLDYLEAMRWPAGVACVACGSLKVSRITREAKSKNKRTRIYQCLKLSASTNSSPPPGRSSTIRTCPQEVVFAIAIICEAKKGVSACQMQRHLGVNYRTAWHLCHRIREGHDARQPDSRCPRGRSGRNLRRIKSAAVRVMHGRKTKQDDIVLGMVERGGGRVKLIPCGGHQSPILQPLLEKHISEHVGTIYSDDHPIYVFALKHKWPGKHAMIDHTKPTRSATSHQHNRECVLAFQARPVRTFHHVSTKHLRDTAMSFRIGSIAGRNSRNVRGDQQELLNGERLTYEKLTASEVSES